MQILFGLNICLVGIIHTATERRRPCVFNDEPEHALFKQQNREHSRSRGRMGRVPITTLEIKYLTKSSRRMVMAALQLLGMRSPEPTQRSVARG